MVAGETIGSYRIIGQIGSGGMGEVYLAEHRHLRRKAAIKVLARELAEDADLLARFFVEARATSLIEHPGIVQVFDCEITAEGRPYIVMEYLAGETLSATLARRGALPATAAAGIARGIAEALAAAHAKGIIHRDLKPDNIFVQPQPPDAVKLVDFGIAKLAADANAGQVNKTRSGILMGTPLYMSPEQCRGAGGIDHRTDLYSLGCVLFEMVAGRPPFQRPGVGELIVAHLTEPPPDLRVLAPAVPAVLGSLIAELLSKEPALRPASMRDVSERLSAFTAGATTVRDEEPAVAATVVAPPSSPSRPPSSQFPRADTTFASTASELAAITGASRDQRGRRGLVAVAAVVAVVVLGGGGALIGSRLGGRQPPPEKAPVVVVGGPVARVPVAAVRAAAPAPTPPPSGAVEPSPSPAPLPPPPSVPPPRPEERSRGSVARGPAVRAAPRGRSPAASPGIEPPPSPSPALRSPPPPPPAAAVPPPPALAEKRPLAAASKPESASAPAPMPTPTSVSAPAPAAFALAGIWEGPWNDREKGQQGSLRLDVGAAGRTSGLLYNSVARQSFRLYGRVTASGDLELVCQCPPAATFTARGALRPAAPAELRGQLSLVSGSSAFGTPTVVLHRKPP